MAIYKIQAPDGKTYKIEGPDGASKEEVVGAVLEQFPYAGKTTEELKQEKSAPTSMADIGRSLVSGGAGGIKALTDIFGADNAASRSLEQFQRETMQNLTPERKEEISRREEIKKRATGLGEELSAYVGGFTEAPIQTSVEALASSLPIIAGGFVPGGGQAMIAGRAAQAASRAAPFLTRAEAVQTGIGGLMGLGGQKGQEYQTVRDALIEKGVSREEAERTASQVSAYGLEALPRQVAGFVAGALEGKFGVEGVLSKYAVNKNLSKSAAGLAKPASWSQALGTSVVGEAAPEALQAAVGTVGSNLALNQAGIPTDITEGLAGSVAHDALVGAVLGLGVSPLQKQTLAREFAQAQAMKAKEQAEAFEKERADKERQRKEEYEQALSDFEQSFGKPMLALPAPAKDVSTEKQDTLDKLQNPLGNFTRQELGEQVSSYIDQYRSERNMPRLNSFSIEDIRDAMTAKNPEGEAGALSSAIKAKIGETDQTFTKEDVINAAERANVDTSTPGFSDFLTRVTAESDLNKMTQPQLHAAFTALEKLGERKEGETQRLVLPEGTNASRFTQDQLNEGLTLLAPYMDQANGALTEQEALDIIKAQTDLKEDRDAKSLLKTASQEGLINISKGKVFDTVDENGEVTASYTTEQAASENLRKGETIVPNPRGNIYSINPDTKRRETVPGYEFEERVLEGDQEAPAGYAIVPEGKTAGIAQVATLGEVESKINRLTGLRQNEASKLLAKIKKYQATVAKRRAAVESMEARGQSKTDAYKRASAHLSNMEKLLAKRINALNQDIEGFQAPLKAKPVGKKKVVREAVTVRKDGKVVGTYPDRATAVNSILSTMPDEELRDLAAKGGSLGDRAAKILEGKEAPGIRVKGTREGLEKAGVITTEVRQKLDALQAVLEPMLAKFGLKDVAVKAMATIDDGLSDGQFKSVDKLIEIALTAKKPLQTMRHEILHAMKALGFFTPQQWNVLVEKAKSEWVDKYLKSATLLDEKGEEIIKNGKPVTRYDYYLPEGMDIVYEEAIADAFADFDSGATKAPAGMIQALMNKMREFFNALKKALGMAKIESAEEIFGRAERGELAPGAAEGEAGERQSISNRVTKKVAEQLGLNEDMLSATSLGMQTGKTGKNQFDHEKVGGIPDIVRFLESRRRETGVPVLDIEKAEDREILADLMAAEAMASINAGGSALEWYDETVARTMSMASLKFEELRSDPNAQMAFKIAIAITSQGMNVEDNLSFGFKQYEYFRENGRFEEIGKGTDLKAMQSNFVLANEMMAQYTMDELRKFLQTPFKVEELRYAGFKIGGELGDEMVLGSSIFGPKIGFGFYSNLNGNFEPTTMDMWFMRLVGRLTGKLRAFDPEIYRNQLARFRAAFDEAGTDGLFADEFKPDELEKARANDDAALTLAEVVNSAFNKEFKDSRELYDEGARRKTELVYAAQNLIKTAKAPKDAPETGAERRNLRDVVKRMVEKVEKAHGERIPPASLQALVWYPEQELYSALGAKLRVTSQDYAGAMQKILEDEGYETNAIRRASADGARQVRRMDVEQKQGATATTRQESKTPYTEVEREEFLGKARSKEVVRQEKEEPRRKRVVFEVAPNPDDAELNARWNKLTAEQKLEVSNKIIQRVVKQVLDTLGAKGTVAPQVGSYQGQTNPSFALYLDKGNSVEVANYLGFVLDQKEMVVISPTPGKGLFGLEAIVVDVKTQDANQIDAIYQKLRSIKVGDQEIVGGQSTMNDKMIILNFPQDDGSFLMNTGVLAQRIKQTLGNDYDVATSDVFVSFPSKDKYDYSNPQTDPRGAERALRQTARDIRGQIQTELRTELDSRLGEERTAKSQDRKSVRSTSFPDEKSVREAIKDLKAPDTKEFWDWFKSSYFVDKDGKPLILYHGTAQNIFQFIAKRSGAIFVTPRLDFATSFADSSENYIRKQMYQTLDKGEKVEMFQRLVDRLITDSDMSTAEGKKIISQVKRAAPKYGDFFGGDMEEAMYQELLSMSGLKGNIMPLYVSAQNVFDYENPKHVDLISSWLWRNLPDEVGKMDHPEHWLANRKGAIGRGLWNAIEQPSIQAGIRALGFDGFTIKEGGVKNYAVYNPAQLKSATGNIGSYSELDPDIRRSVRSRMVAPNTPEFKRWFGNSKAVDENGEPLVVYHASKNFEGYEFKKMPKANRTGNPDGYYFSPSPSDAADYVRDLEYIADRIQNPEKYDRNSPILYAEGAEIIPVYLSIKNPYDYKAHKAPSLAMVRQYEKELRADNPRLGDDWINEKLEIFKEGIWPSISFPTDAMTRVIKAGGYDGMKDGRHWIAFDSNQIKSATGNTGAYNPNDPDIRRSVRSRIVAPNTPEFKRLFKDSKVVDADGKPLVLYHGTNQTDELADDPDQAITQFNSYVNWFTTDPYQASGYATKDGKKVEGATTYPVYVSLKNPIYIKGDLNDKTTYSEFRKQTGLNVRPGPYEDEIIDGVEQLVPRWWITNSPSFAEQASARGHDGVVANENKTKTYGVFYTHVGQIKSAIGNIGTYNPNDLDIRRSVKSMPTVSTQADEAVDRTTTAREQKGYFKRMAEAIAPKSAAYFRQKALDRYNALSNVDKLAAEAMGGAELLADSSAHAMALLSDLSAGVTASVLGFGDRRGGIPVLRGGATTVDNSVKGLTAILEPIARYNDPRVYQYLQFVMGYKRGTRFDAEGREHNFSKSDKQFAEELMQKFPEFKTFMEEYEQFNKGLMNYLVDTNVLSRDKADYFMKYADYVPFYRQMEGEKTIGPNIFTGISGSKKLKEAKGGEAPLADFLETLVRNTQSSINMGMKNHAAVIAAKNAVIAGVAEKVAYENGKTYVQTGPEYFQVMENGQQVSYRTHDALLIDSLMSLNMPDLPFMGVLSAPSNWLRNLVTKDPAFMMANLLRDSLSSYITSGQNLTPIASTVMGFVESLTGKSEGFKALMNSGALGGYEFSANTEASGQALLKDLQKKYGAPKGVGGRVLQAAESLWDALERGTTASDAATRAKVYEQVLADTGNEAEALFRAVEIMNFNRKGNSPLIRILTAAVPFLNARMQGLDVFYRAGIAPWRDKNATEQQKAIQRTFWTRGMMLASLSLMYFAMVHDDDEWKKQEQETKDNNWIIPSMGIKIPIPFEVGVLFKVIPERIAAYSFGDDTGQDTLKSIERNLWGTLGFNPIPQTFKPIVEVVTNYDFFTGRKIIGQGMEDVESQYQTTAGTSKVAESIASMIGASPMIVDHLIKGYTGSMGMYMIDAVDSVLDLNSDSPKVAKRFEQLPVLRRFLADPEARGNVTAFYELKNATDTLARTMNLLEKTNPTEFVKYARENPGLLLTRDYVLEIEKDMKELREMKSVIQSSGMSGTDKRDALVELGRLENSLTANIQQVKKLVASMQ